MIVPNPQNSILATKWSFEAEYQFRKEQQKLDCEEYETEIDLTQQTS